VRRLAAVLVLALLAAGCGGGTRITETREVAPFDRLEVAGVNVTVVPGEGNQVRVRAGEKVIDRVRTESRDGVLRIDVPERGIVIGSDPLGDAAVEVTATSLAGAKIDGSGNMTMTGLRGDALEIDIQGTGDLEASGTVGRLTATLQGVGDADLSRLQARTARVLVQGPADAELNVTDELDVRVQGPGDVTYRGDPDVTSDVDGPGDVKRAP
jgi:Putative auto-transporter adhesin, head GIN domain